MDWRYYLLKYTGYSSYVGETSGKTLEFIGTSGVGKTTLFRESVGKLKSRWLFSYHFEFLRRKAPLSEIDKSLIQILERRVEKIFDSDMSSPFHSLLDLKLSVRVMHEAMLSAHVEHPKGFAFDEGLFRHFPAEILQTGEEFPAELWKNRALVYVKAADIETALLRLRVRKRTASQRQIQRSKTDNEFLERVQREQAIFQSLVERASSLGCPVLVITAEAPFSDSIRQVLNFESSLAQKFGSQAAMQTGDQ